MSPPKYASVLWIESETTSIVESKHVLNKVMLFDHNLVGEVEYPNGKRPPFPRYKARVFEVGGRISCINVSGRFRYFQRISTTIMKRALSSFIYDLLVILYLFTI